MTDSSILGREASMGHADALLAGSRLAEFEILSLLGVGGFGMVYKAFDHSLHRAVAIKEYMPSALAGRLEGQSLQVRTSSDLASYQAGLASFVGEARLLAQFDHPSLVKVFRFWPENGTAYMAMPYYEGITLKRWLCDLGTQPSERWLRKLCSMLMEALSAMHAQNCFHRDVAPDNILMLYDRKAAMASGDGGSYLEQRPKPVLLDFGAARRVIGDATQNLTAILKSGYSPVEQYEGEVSQRQGAWTDVYALCAVLYTAAIGKPPPSSVARVVRDDMIPARVAGKGRYGDPFLHAIDMGLSVRPDRRPRDMAELRALLNAPEAPPVEAPSPATPKPRRSIRTEAEQGLHQDLERFLDSELARQAMRASRPAWLMPAIAAGALLLAAVVAAVFILKR